MRSGEVEPVRKAGMATTVAGAAPCDVWVFDRWSGHRGVVLVRSDGEQHRCLVALWPISHPPMVPGLLQLPPLHSQQRDMDGRRRAGGSTMRKQPQRRGRRPPGQKSNTDRSGITQPSLGSDLLEDKKKSRPTGFITGHATVFLLPFSQPDWERGGGRWVCPAEAREPGSYRAAYGTLEAAEVRTEYIPREGVWPVDNRREYKMHSAVPPGGPANTTLVRPCSSRPSSSSLRGPHDALCAPCRDPIPLLWRPGKRLLAGLLDGGGEPAPASPPSAPAWYPSIPCPQARRGRHLRRALADGREGSPTYLPRAALWALTPSPPPGGGISPPSVLVGSSLPRFPLSCGSQPGCARERKGKP